MLEFSISNQLLSRLDAATVVANSENYLECSFQFSQDWENTVAVATFGHSQVQQPISVQIVDGTCMVPHEVIKTPGFQLSVYGTAAETEGKVCHIPTNVLTVEVEASGAGQGLTPAQPTQSLYSSLMTAFQEGQAAVSAAKVSAQTNAELAKGQKELAAQEADRAEQAAEDSATSATSCATDALSAREVWEKARTMKKQMELAELINQSYTLGSTVSRGTICTISGITWTDGKFESGFASLLDRGDGRYRVRVDDTWYDVVASWDLVERAKTTHSDQAELLGGPTVLKSDGEIPEVPGGEEAGGGSTQTGGGGSGSGSTGTSGGSSDDDEIPEVPGGDEGNPGHNTGDDETGGPVVKPIIHYETARDILRLKAGPVTIEDIRVDLSEKISRVCRLSTIDTTVQEVEICADGDRSAKYYYEQALAAALRAEAAAALLGS